MRFEAFSFGSIRIDGITFEHDVVIDRGWVRKRKKKPSKKFRDEFGHTPLCLANCYFAHDSSGFPILLLFFDAQSGRSCYPFDRHAGPVARTWWRPFPGRGVASPETPVVLVRENLLRRIFSFL